MKKATRKIWYNGDLWDIVKLFRPTKFDVYILVQKVNTHQAHSESKLGKPIHPIEMRLIDYGNNEFYPDSKEVQQLMKYQKDSDDQSNLRQKRLSEIWLNSVTVLKDKTKINP